MINRGKKRRNGSMRQLRKSFARGQIKIDPPQDKLIEEIESFSDSSWSSDEMKTRKEIEMNNDTPTTDEPGNQPGEPEPTTPSSSEINTESNERETEVLSDPDLMAGINKGIEDAKEGRTTPVDFSEHLDDENAGDGEGALANESPSEK